MLTDEDRQRLLESRHDLGALANPDLLVTEPTMKAAVVTSRDELQTKREVLRQAAAEVSKERSETDVERTKVQTAVDAGTRRYGFIRGKVQDALLNPDPDTPVQPEELERRYKLFQRIFKLATSDVQRMERGAAIEAIGGVAQSMVDEPDLKVLGYGPSLQAVYQAAVTATEGLNREVDEDSAAMTKLRGARQGFDRSMSAHGRLIHSVLERQGREEELGKFVLARDAAYAARRAARVPITEEPGANEVETAPAAPAAPTAPPA